MTSLSAIPEPSHHAPKTDAPDAVHQPLSAVVTQEKRAVAGVSRDVQKPGPDAEEQIDSAAVLLLLLIAGALLRLVLGLLGPLQGIATQASEQAHQNARDLLAGSPADAYPLFDLLSLGVMKVGLSAWSLVALGSVLTLAAIPAAFVVGQTLTGRRAAGTLAAALVAVHPAVLTAANSFGSSAIVLGLVTIGLAMLCLIEKRAAACAMVGGALLGLAALAAPLCWVVGAAAGPLTYKLARGNGMGQALSLGALVILLALVPAGAYRALMLGHHTGAVFTEFTGDNPAAGNTTPIDRVLISTTDASFEELGQAMHLPLGDAGRLNFANTIAPAADAPRDVVADTLADGWLLINAALAGFAAVSVGIMLARRRWAETLVLALPILALAFCTLEPSETLRLPQIALVGALSIGLLATPSEPRIDEAEQQAKRLAKQAKREAKLRDKQERELAKHKDSLYAFDRPKKAKPRRLKEAPRPGTSPTTLSPQDDAAVASPARPI